MQKSVYWLEIARRDGQNIANVVTNVVTDSNGFFARRGVSGQALMLALAKESYEEVPGTNQKQFVYYGVANVFQPVSHNPVVFRLRKEAVLK